jgi:hypothetical protein
MSDIDKILVQYKGLVPEGKTFEEWSEEFRYDLRSSVRFAEYMCSEEVIGKKNE